MNDNTLYAFDTYKQEKNLDRWQGFPELMWKLGFEMDCCNSFEEYKRQNGFILDYSLPERQQRRKILFWLEHADKQIVGNYLFSEWRYYTHWSMGYNDFDVDFLWRILAILESKL